TSVTMGIEVMRRRCAGLFLVAAAVLASATVLPASPSVAQTLRDLLPFGRTHRIAKLLQVVVNITVHKISAGGNDAAGTAAPRRIQAFGSGFIIDPSGLVVTHRHVGDNALDLTSNLSVRTALP